MPENTDAKNWGALCAAMGKIGTRIVFASNVWVVLNKDVWITYYKPYRGHVKEVYSGTDFPVAASWALFYVAGE